MLMIHGDPSEEIEPGNGSFYYPTLSLYHEPSYSFRSERNFKFNIQRLTGLGESAAIGFVAHYFFQNIELLLIHL